MAVIEVIHKDTTKVVARVMGIILELLEFQKHRARSRVQSAW